MVRTRFGVVVVVVVVDGDVVVVVSSEVERCEAGGMTMARCEDTFEAVDEDQIAVPTVRAMSPARAIQEGHRLIVTASRLCPMRATRL